MTIGKTLFALGILWGASFCAVALDSSKDVKVTPLLKTSGSWDGTPTTYPAGTAEITGMLVEVAPGGETGWHLHPVPSFGMILQGTLEVTLKDGRAKRLQAGEAIAEVIDTWHNGRNVGATPLKLVVFYAGVAGKPLTVKETSPGVQ